MEIVYLISAFISGGALGAVIVFLLFQRNIKIKEQTLDGEIKSFHRATTQLTNFLVYDGTSTTQEEID